MQSQPGESLKTLRIHPLSPAFFHLSLCFLASCGNGEGDLAGVFHPVCFLLALGSSPWGQLSRLILPWNILALPILLPC